MKTSHPQLGLAMAALLMVALTLSSCNGRSVREVLGLNIAHTVTHIAAGQSAHLMAYQEYRESSNSVLSAQASTLSSILRTPVVARWSVSDSALANIKEDGTLTAIKPGRVTVTGVWENYTATTVIEVVKGLPLAALPQIDAPASSSCRPQTADLSLDENRTLRFRMSFDGCDDLQVEAKAGESRLPWKFYAGADALEIREARGTIVKGVVRRRGEEISFTTWSSGAGAYPVSLAGRKVLLVGDSMAEGIAPSLRKRVEAAGGTFVAAPEQSSTIIWWQGTGRLRSLIGEYSPDIIFIALGSNELFMKEPLTRAPLIQNMVADIGGREAYWIGPPSWKPGSGLVPVIEENFQAGHFYNSDHLEVPRAPDGKHPTAAGYERWVESVWDWYGRTI